MPLILSLWRFKKKCASQNQKNTVANEASPCSSNQKSQNKGSEYLSFQDMIVSKHSR